MANRQDRERAFHDDLFSSEEGRPADAFYAISQKSFRFYEEQITARGAGRRVLEYGCGRTSYATFMAAKGARVTGIDISEVAVEAARRRAKEADLDEATEFRVMDAEALELGDERFDLLFGTGILHHLDIDRAYTAVASALAPGASAVFLEPLGHNPLINLYRRLTPSQRSVDEHPLMLADVERAEAYFPLVQARFFHLSSLAALALRGRRSFEAVVRAFDAVDERLFRLAPASRAWAWVAVMVLTAPSTGDPHSGRATARTTAGPTAGG